MNLRLLLIPAVLGASLLCSCSQVEENKLILNDEYYQFTYTDFLQKVEKGKNSFCYFNSKILFYFSYNNVSYDPLTLEVIQEHYDVSFKAYKHYNDKVFTSDLSYSNEFSYAIKNSGLDLKNAKYEDLAKITDKVLDIYTKTKFEFEMTYILECYTPVRGVLRYGENDKTEYLAYSYAKSQGIVE